MDRSKYSSFSSNASFYSICGESPAVRPSKSRYASLLMSGRSYDTANSTLLNSTLGKYVLFTYFIFILTNSHDSFLIAYSLFRYE